MAVDIACVRFANATGMVIVWYMRAESGSARQKPARRRLLHTSDHSGGDRARPYVRRPALERDGRHIESVNPAIDAFDNLRRVLSGGLGQRANFRADLEM